jgi:hypothetical protein
MLKYQHISKGVAQTLQTIEKRASGEIKSLKTSKPAFNAALMNGID